MEIIRQGSQVLINYPGEVHEDDDVKVYVGIKAFRFKTNRMKISEITPGRHSIFLRHRRRGETIHRFGCYITVE